MNRLRARPALRRRLPRWLASRSEHVGLGAALTVIAALIAWWAVFAWRMIGTIRSLSEENARLLYADQPEVLADRLEQVRAESERMFWMIEGEGGLFILLLLLSVSFLFLMARRNRRNLARVERQLQLATHELKTPIAGVRALLQTLRRGAVPPELQQDLLGQGLQACDHLDHVAETMLACQRAAAGRVQPQVLSANDLVIRVLEHRAATGVPEMAELDLGPDVLVKADPDAFRVVLENLLDNARKYASGAVSLRARAEAGAWSLAVADAGQGFLPADAEAIFEPFERRHREGGSHGSGLGLALSRQLAYAMGGDLRAASPGRGLGAVFTVELPLAHASGRRVPEVRVA